MLASEAASVGNLEDYLGSYYDLYLPSSYKSALNALKASAALGAVEWVLFSITLAFLVLAFINSTKSTTTSGGLEGGVEPKATELNTYGGDPTPAGYAPQQADPYVTAAPPAQAYAQQPNNGAAPAQHPPA